MLPLFNINTNFCNYVGAKYGCAVNSATNAIFLAFEGKKELVTIPSVLPPVVFNALHHSGQEIQYKDDVDWVGGSYELHNFGSYKVIDSAQRVDRNQFKWEANDEDLMIFSFYPTKPVGGIDGGIIVSNDLNKIEHFKQRSLNGMSFSENNWDRKQISIGWKMYMNSFQAFIANQNLKLLDKKTKALDAIRDAYNSAFGLKNTSSHLYRLNVEDRDKVITHFTKIGIATGIHYAPLHTQELYKQDIKLPISEADAKSTISIPFNEKLTVKNIDYIITEVNNVIL